MNAIASFLRLPPQSLSGSQMKGLAGPILIIMILSMMVLPLGPHSGPQRLVKLTKTPGGTRQDDLIWVRFVPLLPGQAREL